MILRVVGDFLFLLELADEAADGDSGGAAGVGNVLMSEANGELSSLGAGLTEVLFEPIQKKIEALLSVSLTGNIEQHLCLLESLH